jgi:GST-like protein
MYTLIGAPGWGSAIAEALLDLSGLPYQVEDIDPKKPTTESKRLTALNPLAQVPTLLLPDGTVMSESAAIALHIADRAPAAALVPPPGDPTRDAFLRWLVFIVANVYPMYTVGDFPERFVSGPRARSCAPAPTPTATSPGASSRPPSRRAPGSSAPASPPSTSTPR